MLSWTMEHPVMTLVIVLVAINVLDNIICNVCNTVNQIHKRNKGEKK